MIDRRVARIGRVGERERSCRTGRRRRRRKGDARRAVDRNNLGARLNASADDNHADREASGTADSDSGRGVRESTGTRDWQTGEGQLAGAILDEIDGSERGVIGDGRINRERLCSVLVDNEVTRGAAGQGSRHTTRIKGVGRAGGRRDADEELSVIRDARNDGVSRNTRSADGHTRDQAGRGSHRDRVGKVGGRRRNRNVGQCATINRVSIGTGEEDGARTATQR